MSGVDPVFDGKQELQRIIEEIEKFSATLPISQAITKESIVNWVCEHCGYEDEDELEDALQGPLMDLIQQLPHFEIEDRDGISFARNTCIGNPEDDASMWKRPCVLRAQINKTDDLFKVLVKSKHARISIPSLEFEIGAGAFRTSDTLYNIIVESITEIIEHVRLNSSHAGVIEKREEAFVAQIDELNKAIDVEKPYEILVTDYSGLSFFRDEDFAKYEPMDDELEQHLNSEQKYKST